MKPWDFDALSPSEKARLHALYSVEHEIESYYESEKARILQRK